MWEYAGSEWQAKWVIMVLHCRLQRAHYLRLQYRKWEGSVAPQQAHLHSALNQPQHEKASVVCLTVTWRGLHNKNIWSLTIWAEYDTSSLNNMGCSCPHVHFFFVRLEQNIIEQCFCVVWKAANMWKTHYDTGFHKMHTENILWRIHLFQLWRIHLPSNRMFPRLWKKELQTWKSLFGKFLWIYFMIQSKPIVQKSAEAQK